MIPLAAGAGLSRGSPRISGTSSSAGHRVSALRSKVASVQETSDVRTDRDAWRTQVERLTRNERERLPWWKRLAG